MSKTIKYLISGIVLLVGFLIFTSYKACDLYDKNSILKGRDIELTKAFSETYGQLKVLQSDNTVLISALEESRIEAKEAAKKYETASTKIQDTFRTVGEMKANADNDKALIIEMEIEINKRDEAISKLGLAMAEKNKEISSMQRQYTALAIELRKTKSVLDESVKLNILRAERIKELEKSFAKSRFSGQLKTGVVIGLTALVVYGLVK